MAEAFLNDPYDWDGPKATHVCATEADMDGALTMQILELLTGGTPVLFADVRHYHADKDVVWDLRNSGQHATARRSTFEWPHAFTRLHASADEFLTRFGANHIHAVPGEHVDELEAVCALLDIDYEGMGDAP